MRIRVLGVDEMEKRINNRLKIRRAGNTMGAVDYARDLQLAISQFLNVFLGDKADHFVVTMTGSNQYMWQVKIEPKDDIGSYLYWGTEGHWIGGPGQVLVNPDGQFGPVRGPVWHPGQEALREEIDACIDEARAKVKVFRQL